MGAVTQGAGHCDLCPGLLSGCPSGAPGRTLLDRTAASRSACQRAVPLDARLSAGFFLLSAAVGQLIVTRRNPDGLAREWRQGNESSYSFASIPLPPPL